MSKKSVSPAASPDLPFTKPALSLAGRHSQQQIVASVAGKPNAPVAVTVASLIDSAFDEIQSLAWEMREAFDCTPENLQNSEVGQRREDAADSLENLLDCPEILPWLDGIVTKFTYRRTRSRRDRAYEAVCMLRTSAEAIRVRIVELQCYADDLLNTAEELDCVEFPGMYG